MSSKRKAVRSTTRRSKRKVGNMKEEEEPADDPPKGPSETKTNHEKASHPLICACTVPCSPDNDCPCPHSGCRSGHCGCACFDGEAALLQRYGCIVRRGVGMSMTYLIDHLHHPSIYQPTHTITHLRPIAISMIVLVVVVVLLAVAD
jgi:hypothetical protein